MYVYYVEKIQLNTDYDMKKIIFRNFRYLKRF